MPRRIVLDFGEPRPILRRPPWLVERVRAALPGWDVVAPESRVDARGDGAGASPEGLAAATDAEVYMGFGISAEVLRAGPGLRWVHTGTAGVGGSLTPELLERRDVVFTNSAAVHGPPMAESAIAAMLYFARGFDVAVEAQRRGRWDKRWFDADPMPLREVAGATVGVVGYGGVGREIGVRARALGARVLGLRRRPGDDEVAEVLTGAGGLRRLLDESDYLVVSAPETGATRGLIDAAALRRLGPDAVLLNVSRGSLVDENALAAALVAGRLRGAWLDVFTAEPLPDGHPLWSAPRLLITPHVSAYTSRFWEREAGLIEENLRRWLDGRPLLNVVDREAGY